MKKQFAVLVLALAASTQAHAADLGGYKEPTTTLPYMSTMWTGFYVGGQIGESVSLGDLTVERGLRSVNTNGLGASGIQGVISGGYDYHPPMSKFVFGGFAQYAVGDQTWERSTSSGRAIAADLTKEWAVGGRIGYLVTQGILAYAKLGYAAADLEISASYPIPNVKTPSLNGGIIGTGLDISLGGGLFATSEYTYTAYDDANIYNVGRNRADVGVESHKFMTGFTYKFGGGAMGMPGLSGLPGTTYK